VHNCRVKPRKEFVVGSCISNKHIPSVITTRVMDICLPMFVSRLHPHTVNSDVRSVSGQLPVKHKHCTSSVYS